MKLRVYRIWLGILLLLAGAAWLPASTSDVYAHTTDYGWVLGNSRMERSFSYGQGHWRTLQITNKLDGQTIDPVSSEFSLQLAYERIGYEHGSANPLTVTTDDFTVSEIRAQDLPDGGVRLAVSLEGTSRLLKFAGGIEATLYYELHPQASEMRKWIVLKVPRARTSYIVSRVTLEDMSLSLPPLWPAIGFGQPVFTGDLFWGIEFPATENRMRGDQLRLSYIDGRLLDLEHPYTSEKAVLGVAAVGQVEGAFAAYVNRIRARPARPFVLYNSWYDLQAHDLNQANLLQRVDQFRRRGGIALNSFVLDDGWDDLSGEWRVDRQQFPDGFGPLSAALNRNGSHLGLWFGPGGGYAENARKRLASGRRLGLEELQGQQWFCIAGPRYHSILQHRLVEAVTAWNVNYLKLDGVPFGCNNPDHGHPIGIYSSPALTRSWISILQAVRRARPDVFINFTTGSWLSPWWLRYADTLWMGGADYGYLNNVPIISPRQAAMTYKDSVLYGDFVRHHDQVPLSSIMTHGIIDGRLNRLGGDQESPLSWTDGIIDYVGQGTMMWELYITPSLLSPVKWKALSTAVNWAKSEHATLLGSGSMVLGDPAAGEIYGFLHRQPGHTLLVLRNPSITPGEATLPLPRIVNPQGPGPWEARLIYPWQQDLQRNSTGGLSLHLGGYETAMVELDQQAEPVRILHARAVRQSAGAWQVWRAPGGADPVVELPAATGLRVELDGHPLTPQGQEVALPIDAPGPGMTAANVQVATPQGGWEEKLQVTVAGTVDAPRVGVLLRAAAGTTLPALTCVVDGAGVKPELYSPKGASWQWTFVPLTPGTHAVGCSVKALPDNVEAGSWLLGRQHLAAHHLVIQGLKTPLQARLHPPQWNGLVPIRQRIEGAHP